MEKLLNTLKVFFQKLGTAFKKFFENVKQVFKPSDVELEDIYLEESEVRKYRIKKFIFGIFVYAFLLFTALFILIPFYWMFATAFRPDSELAGTTVNFFPTALEWANFGRVFEQAPYFFRYFGNTVVVAFLTTAGTMVTTVLAAFAFARLNFRGKEAIFSIFLATMMIPGEVFVITNYMTVSQFANNPLLSWATRNTYGALVLPFLVSVFYTFFLRQTFKQIPNELYLASKVDGTGDFKYLWRVMIPIAKATITTIFILSMMGTWNALIWPSLVANAEEMRLVSNGLLQAFKSDVGQTPQNLQMAASALVTLPLLIVFIFMKKYIMRGVSRSGIKG